MTILLHAEDLSSERKENYSKEIKYFDKLHKEKYRDTQQTKIQHTEQLADSLASDCAHREKIYDAIYYNRFLAAGRVQAAKGATEREVSPFNCSVSQTIEDNIDSIYQALHMSAKILRLGTGIGYNFSNLRPKGALVKSLQTEASGPISYMHVYDKSAATIASSGHRRGAQMGILNVSHPDIEAFIDSKMVAGALRQFNISVGITDSFMHCVHNNYSFNLEFDGKVYKQLPARMLWEKITRNAYESAEPGLIFIDRINSNNNLYYCEQIEATNPCSEQPLPPYGLCTLGSFNLVAYLIKDINNYLFNFNQFEKDIATMVEAYDNIFDDSIYAIPEHEAEAKNKRRIGLGLTGIANAIELMVGRPCYGEPEFCDVLKYIASFLVDRAYEASINLAKKRGAFPLYDKEKYSQSKFIKTLPAYIQEKIEQHGIRNSHLISYAPCGTISQIAGNISSGVEPVFHHEQERDVYMKDGKSSFTLTDFAYRELGFKGKTLEECSVEDHLNVAEICQTYCDSAVSKTVNVASNCSYEDYQQIYKKAYKIGLKGITIYRPTELRGAVIKKAVKNETGCTIPMSTEYQLNCANGACER